MNRRVRLTARLGPSRIETALPLAGMTPHDNHEDKYSHCERDQWAERKRRHYRQDPFSRCGWGTIRNH